MCLRGARSHQGCLLAHDRDLALAEGEVAPDPSFCLALLTSLVLGVWQGMLVTLGTVSALLVTRYVILLLLW